MTPPEDRHARFDTMGDGIARITIDRPQRLGAYTPRMCSDILDGLRTVRLDDAIRVLVLTGTGRGFCTGGDVSPDAGFAEALDHQIGRARELREDSHAVITALHKMDKPVICAVNGMTVGGGLHFVADCDIVIASETASFFDTHVRVGLVAGLEPVALTRKVAFETVMRMALMGGGERMSASQALAAGLVSECAPADQLMARARAIADVIKQNAPMALARTKQAIWQSLELPLEAALENASRLIGEHNAGPDFAEGQAAFLEHRAPRWSPYSDGEA